MAQNYAEKYSAKVDERFTQASLTDAAVNKDYDFVGVNAVNVYSIPTVALGDYTMSGDNRYGTPAELDDTVQTLTMTQDKAFTFTLDKRNEADSAGAKSAGAALRRQIDEVIIPTIDKYRLAAWVAGAGNTTAAAAVTAENAYSIFLDAQNMLMDDLVPTTNRIAYVSPAFYKFIKLDNSFIKAGDMAQGMLVNGSVGNVDGVNIVPVPTSYLPTGVELLIVHKSAMTSPVKLTEYKTHIDPPGINGTLVEGRLYYDAFVLENKKNGIVVHKKA
ncbi:MAG: N4-gp56 family major capsid protein [Clostridia bacterium]|nr:N4-gp56 family major capsid protein [Clostridia bacterium]